jgi:hypothetical protein
MARHCERSEAIQGRVTQLAPPNHVTLPWIASSLALLAMTGDVVQPDHRMMH